MIRILQNERTRRPGWSFPGTFLVAVCALLLLTLGGCKSPGGTPSAEDGEIIVSAAASLKDSFDEIGQLYMKRNATRVRFNYGASGVLQKQLESNAPVDVFASAGSRQMDELEGRGIIDGHSRRDFARNTLVLITWPGSSRAITSFADLLRPDVGRIVIANPKTVPAGQYAEQTLEALNAWQQIQSRLVFAEDVRQALEYVARGEIEAGIVYASDAFSAGAKVKVAATAPENSHSPIVYPIAMVSQSRQQKAAREFIDLVLSTEGQQILASHGFVAIR